jgi:predicted permease
MNDSFILVAIILFGLLIKMVSQRFFPRHELFDVFTTALTNVIYYFLVPLAFIYTFSTRSLAKTDILIVASFVAYITVAGLSFKYVSRGWGDDVRNAVLLTALFPNAVFLGFPVSLALFGDVKIASILGLATLTLNVLVPDFIALKKISLLKILKLPALVGFLIGVLLNQLGGPGAVVSGILWWSPKTLSYLATFVLGLKLQLGGNAYGVVKKPLLVTIFYRFIIAPLVAVCFSLSVGFTQSESVQLAVVSGMPPAVLNTLMASKYGWRPDLVAYITFILTIPTVLALPIIGALTIH